MLRITTTKQIEKEIHNKLNEEERFRNLYEMCENTERNLRNALYKLSDKVDELELKVMKLTNEKEPDLSGEIPVCTKPL